jgi:hypothetical protein
MEAVNGNVKIVETIPPGPVFAEDEWVVFANSYCGTSLSNVSELPTAVLNCKIGSTSDSNVPSAGIGVSLNFINLWAKPITHLDFLAGLETTIDDIYAPYTQLTNVDGLSSLISVGGYLHLGFNSSLSNINGLSSLVSIGSHADLSNNPLITNLDGLSSLRTIRHSLNLENTPALNDISGLNGVTSSSTVFFDRFKNYTVKLSANSYICLNNRFDNQSVSKKNICEI